MSQSRKKILVSALAGLTLAAKSAFDALNENGRFDGSDMEQDPVRYAHQLSVAMKVQVAELESMEAYEEYSPEELAELRAQEKKAALKKLQDEAAASLKAMKAAREAPSAVEETPDEDADSDEDLDEDDQDLDEDDLDEGDQDLDGPAGEVEGTQEQTDAQPGEGEQLPGSADLPPVAPAEPTTPAEPVVPAAEPAKPAGKAKAPKADK
jgi:hypothetical protein